MEAAMSSGEAIKVRRITTRQIRLPLVMAPGPRGAARRQRRRATAPVPKAPPAIGCRAQRVDEGAVEHTAKERPIGRLPRRAAAAERAIERRLAEQRIARTVGMRGEARPAVVARMADEAGAHGI